VRFAHFYANFPRLFNSKRREQGFTLIINLPGLGLDSLNSPLLLCPGAAYEEAFILQGSSIRFFLERDKSPNSKDGI